VRFDYFYAWIPFVLVGVVVILALPWLAVIALMAVLLAMVAALGSLAWAGVGAVTGLGHSSRHVQAVEISRERVEAGSRT